jgi:hypothetical protein
MIICAFANSPSIPSFLVTKILIKHVKAKIIRLKMDVDINQAKNPDAREG